MANPFNQYKEFVSESSTDMDTIKAAVTETPERPRPLPRTRTLSSVSSSFAAGKTEESTDESPGLETRQQPVMQTPLPRTRVQNLKLLDDYPNAISTPKSEAPEPVEENGCNLTPDTSITVFERKTSASTVISSDSEPQLSAASLGLSNDSPLLKENLWLSKPRKAVHASCTTPSKSSSGRSSPSAPVSQVASLKSALPRNNGCTTPFRSHNRSQSIEQRQLKLTLDYDAILRLDKLKLALNYVSVEPTAEQWKIICGTLQATDSSLIRFGDFVNAVKSVLQVEMDLKGITTGSIFFAASNINNLTPSNNNQSLECTEIASQVEQLKQENQDLHKRLDEVKGSLQERLEACLLAEQEMLFVRKTLQEVTDDKRVLANRLSNLEVDKSHTADHPAEKKLSMQNDKPHEREIYLVAASKLLQFTQVVHNVLSEHNKKISVNQCEKQRSLTRSETTNRVLARKPIRVNRAASVQSASGDVSNYFVRKYGGGGRICRAASTCTVSHKSAEKENGNCIQNPQKPHDNSHGDSKDKLCHLAEKAQELIRVFQAILPEESVTKSAQEINSYLRRTKSTNPIRNAHLLRQNDNSSELTIAWV